MPLADLPVGHLSVHLLRDETWGIALTLVVVVLIINLGSRLLAGRGCKERGGSGGPEYHHGSGGDQRQRRADVPDPRSGPVAMRLEDVAVSFNGRTAIRDASFDVPKNKVTALIGPSGLGQDDALASHQPAARPHQGRRRDAARSAAR